MLKVAFSDFWSDFNPESNYFLSKLSKICKPELSAKPEILFFSAFGKEHKKYDCLKVFFNGERRRPNFRHCDFSISFDIHSYGGRNLRWPLYMLYGNLEQLIAPKNIELILAEKRKFCNFLYSNKKAKQRIRFFKKLSQYKQIDSGGAVMNNMAYRVEDKLTFLSQYKFTIAFENESFPGYSTEKIFQAMQKNSTPIYWGDPLIHNDFNAQSFINVHEYANLDAVVEKIIELDQNKHKYIEKLSLPYLVDNKIPEHLQEETLLNFLRRIIGCK